MKSNPELIVDFRVTEAGTQEFPSMGKIPPDLQLAAELVVPDIPTKGQSGPWWLADSKAGMVVKIRRKKVD